MVSYSILLIKGFSLKHYTHLEFAISGSSVEKNDPQFALCCLDVKSLVHSYLEKRQHQHQDDLLEELSDYLDRENVKSESNSISEFRNHNLNSNGKKYYFVIDL